MTDPTPEELNHIPPLEQVTAAYQDIIAHNKEHTGFGAAFRTIFAATQENGEVISDDDVTGITETEQDSYTNLSDSFDTATTEGDMNAELQDIFHGDTFTRIGIKIGPFGTKLASGDDKQALSTQLVPMVDNTELFVDFLKQQTRTGVQESDENFRLMSDVLGTMQRTVIACFGKETEELPEESKAQMKQFGEDTLRTFVAIDEQYTRLGLDAPERHQTYLEQEDSGNNDEAYRSKKRAEEHARTYNELGNYVKYWGSDVLEEYLAIGSMEQLAERKAWAVDGMQDQFEAEVSSVIELIGPERTTAFGIEAAQATIEGIQTTLTEMDTLPNYWVNNVAGSRELFERNIQRLKDASGVN